MTIIQRSNELSEMMKRIANRAADDDLVKKMEGIKTPLKQHADVIVSLGVSRSLMKEAEVGGEVSVAGTAVKTLQDRIEKLRKRLRENRTQIMAGNVWAECDALATARSRELKQQLLKQWRDFVNQHTPGIEPFRPFANLASCKAVFAELAELDRQSESAQAGLPSTPAEIEAVRLRGEQMRNLINQLGLDGEPPEMQDLLKRCAQNGVALDELTGDALAWLKARGFAASLRIVTN